MSLLNRNICLWLLIPLILFAFQGSVNSSVKSDRIVDYPDTLAKQKNQSEIFNWTDTIFQKGSRRIINFFYPSDGSCTTYPCYGECDEKLFKGVDSIYKLQYHNKNTYDTILNFLAKNKEVKIRLEFHMDLRGNSKFNKSLSDRRAKGCMKEFKRLNADTLRIRTIGMASTKPLISLETISKETDKKKWNDLHRINHRVEVIIE